METYHKRRLAESGHKIWSGPISGIDIVQTSRAIQRAEYPITDELFIVRKGRHWLSKDFKWIRKGRMESSESFFNKTRFFGFDAAFEAMLSCDEYVAEFVDFDEKAFLMPDETMPDMVPVEWSHSAYPVFKGIIKEVFNDEHGFPMTNLLRCRGVSVGSFVISDRFDRDPSESFIKKECLTFDNGSHAIGLHDTEDGFVVVYVKPDKAGLPD